MDRYGSCNRERRLGVRRLSCGVCLFQITSVPLVLLSSRALGGCREGAATLAVNGRVGRRVACVLGELTLEIMDVEGSDSETESMDET